MPQSNRPDLRSLRKPVSVDEEEGSSSDSEVEDFYDFLQIPYVEGSEDEIPFQYTYPYLQEVFLCGSPELLSTSAFVESPDELMMNSDEQQITMFENPEPLNTSAFTDDSKEQSQHEYHDLQQAEQVDQCDAPGPISASALEEDSEEFRIEHQDQHQKEQTDRDHYDTEDLNTSPKRIRRQ
ncbi:hypothetical protein TNCT_645031 [Trichonephila clavata]|uniref:Uncharacterized protein n=1 Tax=Trichonephila clavata TaxID=2740835 RepID=A0A8X6FL82_TRICU|nr:hypothetical protein TNCT_645031 [Trichonephila clavata]